VQLEAVQLTLFLILLGLGPHLLLNGLQLLRLLGKRELLFSVDLFFHEYHVLLELLVFVPEVVFLLVCVIHFGLKLHNLDGLRGQLLPQDTEGTLLNLLLVSIEFCICLV
jgi:hypothetical protein